MLLCLFSICSLYIGQLILSKKYTTSTTITANDMAATAGKLMRGITLNGAGGPDVLTVSSNLARPTMKTSTEVLIKVMATSVNRADTMQRKGMYPAPPGASELLGLEAAGIVESVAPGVSKWSVGDKVMALLGGGGYAQYVNVEEGHCLKMPEMYTFEQAAAIPEVFLTAWQAIRFQASLSKGQTLLTHAGASGVGTAASQLARLLGARAVTTSSEAKVEACKQFADVAVSRTPTENADGKKFHFAPKVIEAIGSNAVDVIIDPVFGGGYLEEDVEVLNTDGQIVVLAFMGGSKAGVPDGLNCVPMFRKRVGIKFSTLRSQSNEYKAKLVESFAAEALAGFSDGRLTPVIDTTFDLFDEVVKAHERIDKSESIGKLVLKVDHS